MEIALCTDDNYIIPTIIFIKSIEINNINEDINYNIIYKDLKKENKQKLSYSLTNKKSTITFYQINTDILKDCPIRIEDHVTLATYYRLLFPSIFPKSVSKILYLDIDILCLGSLSTFYEQNLTNYSCSVIHDERNNDESIFNRLNYSKSNGYFNAGVMLINLEYWRENKIQEKTLNFIQTNKEKCLWHDQDALNYVLNNTVKWSDFKYNFTQGFFFNKKDLLISSTYYKAIDNASNNICLVHFSSAYKPWHIECNHPLKSYYREFYTKIFGKKMKLTHKLKGFNLIKWQIKKYLTIFKIKPYVDFRKPILVVSPTHTHYKNLIIKN